jgi:type I restriction enzyme S subunit
MLILRAKSDKVYEKYFLHYVGSPTFWNQIQKKRSGTAQPQLPAGVLKEFDIPLFAKGIQRNIVQEIESRLSVCDKIEQTIEDSLKKAEALRQSILKKAFAGKLTRDWREKHPELIAGENSAEKLLEKIKAEKAIAASRKKPRSKKTKKK